MVVLPTPGPPVITRTFSVVAAWMASRWLGAIVIFISCSTQFSADSTSMAGSGWSPALKCLMARATPSSARNIGFKYSHGSGSVRSAAGTVAVSRTNSSSCRPASITVAMTSGVMFVSRIVSSTTPASG